MLSIKWLDEEPPAGVCTHCGATVYKPVLDDGRIFCCASCRSVYSLMILSTQVTIRAKFTNNDSSKEPQQSDRE